MKSGKLMSALIVAVVALIFVEIVRITRMISLTEHRRVVARSQEAADVRAAAAEAKYREATGFELHRREMTRLFSAATHRAVEAGLRIDAATLELQQVNSELSVSDALAILLHPTNADAEQRGRLDPRRSEWLRQRRDRASAQVEAAYYEFAQAKFR